jgi:outer membrane biosynthesis protein TonB|tara:strand:+ start:294 stop:590 length:297 start_codon:yes stop_codon:yes gene_type:complete
MKKYCCELKQHIKDNYIPIAHNNTGTVEFHIVIDRAGDILLLNQISSSGDKILDDHAKGTIEKSFPFKAFPKEEMLRSYFSINLPINFKGLKNGSNVK